MPPKKMYKRNRKRVYRKKRNNKSKIVAAKTVIAKGLNPIGDRFITSLKYVDKKDFAVAFNSNAVQQFNLNSLFDPDLTGTGHQPYGFDQISALYNRYRVYKVKYTIIFSAVPGNLYCRAIAGAQNDSTTWLGTDWSVIAERSPVTICYLKADAPTIMKGTIHLPKLCGATKQEYMSDDRYQAQVTASPTEAMCLNYGMQNNNTNGTTTCMADIVIEYFAEFFDPKTLAQS